jgi:hypothetical protein
MLTETRASRRRNVADENIIAVNVPNAVSIVAMAAIGGVVLTALLKLAGKRAGSSVSTGPSFSGA